MELTVLGTASGGVPGPGGAGSGYLLSEGDTRLLVDCGNGILGELAKHCPFEDVSAVYLGHLHADHTQDLLAFALYRRFVFKGGARMPLFGPPGTRTLLYRWFHLFHPHPDPYVEAFQITEVKPWETHEVGDLVIQASPVEHNVPSFALRAQPRSGPRKLFVYSSDTRASALLVEAAQKADLFLAEATFQDLPPGKEAEASREHHMTARDAGEVARKAGAERLVLAHLQYFLDPDVSRAQARECFGGEVDVAVPGKTYEI